MSNLPDFFKGSGTTLIDSLTNFDLGGTGDQDLDALIGEDELETFEDGIEGLNDTFGNDAFGGDLKEESLPEFFATPRKADPVIPAVTTSKSASMSVSLSASQSRNQDDDDDDDELLSSATKSLNFGPGNSTATPVGSAVQGPPPGLAPKTPAAAPATPVAPPLPPMSTPAKNLLGMLHRNKESQPPGVSYASAAAAASTDTKGYTPVKSPASVDSTSAEPSTPATVETVGSATESVLKLQPTYSTLIGAGSLSKPFTEQTLPPRPDFGHGTRMTPSDVRFVVGKVLAPLQSSDPFSDDYYFLQYNIKKNLQAREKSMRENIPPPPILHVPLPAWKDTKERIKLQMEQTRNGFEEKVKEWEEKEQVLGHRIRPELSKPREQLSLPNVADMEFDLDNEDADTDFKSPFSSRLWTTRLAVQQGFEALFTVQELQHLLSSPAVSSNAQAVQEVRLEMDSALALLSQSLGIRQAVHFASPVSESNGLALDGRHIAAILQTNMGKKLLTRSLKLLSPSQRWALLPVVMARIMATPPPPSSSAATPSGQQTAHEAVQVERKLLKTIIEFLQYSYQHHLSVKTQAFTDELLGNLRQSLKNVMISLMDKNSLRDSLLSERTRAEIMNVVVEIGDQIQSGASGQVANDWEQSREAFMSILENY